MLYSIVLEVFNKYNRTSFLQRMSKSRYSLLLILSARIWSLLLFKF